MFFLSGLRLAALVAIVVGAVSARAASQTPASTFVGSTACAACHRSEHSDWLTSQHRAAMQEPTDSTVLGRFDSASFPQGRGRDRLLQTRRQVSHPHRRAGRKACRFRGEICFRRLSAPAISSRIAGRTAPGFRRRMGCASGDGRRTALVRSLSRPQARGGRSAALDRDRSELELSMRLVPFNQSA